MGSEGIMYASVKLEVIDGRAQQGVEHAALGISYFCRLKAYNLLNSKGFVRYT